MKGDYCRFLVDVSMVSQRQAPMNQKVLKIVEVLTGAVHWQDQ